MGRQHFQLQACCISSYALKKTSKLRVVNTGHHTALREVWEGVEVENCLIWLFDPSKVTQKAHTGRKSSLSVRNPAMLHINLNQRSSVKCPTVSIIFCGSPKASACSCGSWLDLTSLPKNFCRSRRQGELHTSNGNPRMRSYRGLFRDQSTHPGRKSGEPLKNRECLQWTQRERCGSQEN